jgi:hypothetical protein
VSPRPNLAGNLADFPGPGDLPAANDPRESRPPLTESEARALLPLMKSGDTQEFLNLFAATHPTYTDGDDFCRQFDAFRVEQLIAESQP